MSRARWAAVVVGLGLLLLVLALWPEAETPVPAPVPASPPPQAAAPPTPSPLPGEETFEVPDEAAEETEDEPGVVTLEAVRKTPCAVGGGISTCDEGLPGMHVAVFAPDDGGLVLEGVTNAEGELPLPDLAHGLYEAQVIEPGWLAERHEFDVDGVARSVILEATKPARFELRVLTPSGLGFRGAKVEFSHDVSFISEGETDDLGRFRVEQAAAGLVDLTVRAPGFVVVEERFVLESDTVKTVTLRRGRTVTVHVVGAPSEPKVMIDLRTPTGDFEGTTLHPPQTSATFTDVPAEPVLLTVTELTHANQSKLLERTVAPDEREVTVQLDGRRLDVFVDGKQPRSGFARGKCCAPHGVELRCEGRPTRRKAFQGPPGSVSFPLVPDAACWVSYDGEREVKVVFPETVLRAD